MASMVPPQYGVAFIFYVALIDQSNTKVFKASSTQASGDWKISKDGGALANLTNLPAVTPAGGVMVQISLTATEMQADNVTVVGIDAAGAEWCSLVTNIQTSVRRIDDLAYPTTSGRAIDVSAGGEVGLDWANIGSPTTTVGLSGTTVKTATDVETDTQDIQSRLPAALVSGRMSADAVAISGDTVAADNAESFFDGTGYAGTNNVIPLVTTTTTATNVTTVNGLAANVITAASINADAITAAKIADGAIDAATFAAGAINAAAIATDAITDAKVASDVTIASVTGAVGSVTAGVTVTTNNDKTGYGLSAAAVQAIWDALTSALTTVGSIGKRISDNLDALISSRMATFTYTTPPTVVAIRTEMDSNSTKLANLDATISSRATPAQVNTEADTALADVGLTTTITGRIDAAISTRLATAGYTVPPTAAANADAVWDETLSGHLATGSTGEALNGAGAAGDPWTTTLPGAYGAGSAGKIIGDNINATIGSRATQVSVDDIPTNAELATSQASADDATLAAIAALNNLSAAGVRTAIGLASANLDTQLDALPTNAELATSQAAADDATLAAIAALNNLSAAQVKTQADQALADYDAPTHAELTTELATADDATLAAIAGISSPSANAIADAVLSRGVSNVENTADTTSLAALILATFESSVAGTVWTIRKSAGGTFVVKTVTVDAAAQPVTGVT